MMTESVLTRVLYYRLSREYTVWRTSQTEAKKNERSNSSFRNLSCKID